MIERWVNQVTGTEVRLVPPVDDTDWTAADVDKLERLLTAWAVAGWEVARLDPKELDTSHLAVPQRVGRTLTNIKVAALMLLPDGTTSLTVVDQNSGTTYQVPGTWRWT